VQVLQGIIQAACQNIVVLCPIRYPLEEKVDSEINVLLSLEGVTRLVMVMAVRLAMLGVLMVTTLPVIAQL
jgi:hypothetical protein